MIKRADEGMLPRLKRMWQICFRESKDDTDFVFDNLLNPEQMLVRIDKSGNPISMMSWKMLRFTTPRNAFMGAYVFGVATMPEFRGRGLSGDLMNELHDILSGEGTALSCLVPASASLFDFYARSGFEKYFSYRKITVEGNVIPDPSAGGVLSSAPLPELEPVRNQAFSKSALFGSWDRAYLGYAERECRYYGGETLRFSCRGRVGYAVCYPRGDGTLLVKEAAINREDVGALFSALHARFRARRYELRMPEDYPGRELPNEILPFAMIKWYDEEKRGLASGTLGGAPWFAFGLD